MITELSNYTYIGLHSIDNGRSLHIIVGLFVEIMLYYETLKQANQTIFPIKIYKSLHFVDP